MTFANVGVNQEQITLLSHLLLAAFPGCTIHQSRDPMRTMQHISSRKIDAVFADADTSSDWLHKFRNHKSSPTVFLLCSQEWQRPEETEAIQGFVTYPVTKQKIQDLLQTVPQGIREVY